MKVYLVEYDFDNGAVVTKCKSVVSAENTQNAFVKIIKDITKCSDDVLYDMKATELHDGFIVNMF